MYLSLPVEKTHKDQFSMLITQARERGKGKGRGKKGSEQERERERRMEIAEQEREGEREGERGGEFQRKMEEERGMVGARWRGRQRWQLPEMSDSDLDNG